MRTTQSRISRHILFLALLPLALALQGCDSGGASENEEINNEFTLTIESTPSSATAGKAAAQATVNGYSFFYDAENPETNEQVFGIYLSNNESFSSGSASQGLFGFMARSSSRPGTGDYEFSRGEGLQPSQFAGFLYEDVANFQNEPFYVIESGTLTLETSSDGEVGGTIDASATKYTFTGSDFTEESVTVTGGFTAKNVETFAGFSTPGV